MSFPRKSYIERCRQAISDARARGLQLNTPELWHYVGQHLRVMGGTTEIHRRTDLFGNSEMVEYWAGTMIEVPKWYYKRDCDDEAKQV